MQQPDDVNPLQMLDMQMGGLALFLFGRGLLTNALLTIAGPQQRSRKAEAG